MLHEQGSHLAHSAAVAHTPQKACRPPLAQVLLAGCHDALRLYRVRIDDASEQSQRTIAAAIARVAESPGEELQEVAVEGQAVGSEGHPSAFSAGQTPDAADTDEHLNLQLVNQVRGQCPQDNIAQFTDGGATVHGPGASSHPCVGRSDAVMCGSRAMAWKEAPPQNVKMRQRSGQQMLAHAEPAMHRRCSICQPCAASMIITLLLSVT